MAEYIVKNEVKLNFIIENVMRKLDPKKAWEIIIRPYKRTRSTSQNALYWVWLTLLERETGNDKEDLHELFKQKFLGVEMREVMGVEIYVTNSTKKREVAEFSEYLQRIEALCVQNGYLLPHPADYEYALGGPMPGE